MASSTLSDGLSLLQPAHASGPLRDERPQAEACGYKLHLSANSSTGYRGVRPAQKAGLFIAQYSSRHLGTFGSAVSAAVAFAKFVGSYEAPADEHEDE